VNGYIQKLNFTGRVVEEGAIYFMSLEPETSVVSVEPRVPEPEIDMKPKPMLTAMALPKKKKGPKPKVKVDVKVEKKGDDPSISGIVKDNNDDDAAEEETWMPTQFYWKKFLAVNPDHGMVATPVNCFEHVSLWF
jgi:hypothetical protein